MNKSELILKLSTEIGIGKEEARDIVSIFFKSISNSLKSGDRVEIRGLCTFSVKVYDSYTGLNPKTGEKVKVKPKYLPVFRCGKELKDRLNHGD